MYWLTRTYTYPTYFLTVCNLDKPVFTELNETTFTGVENENLIISLQAVGHPAIITYTWIKNGVPLAHAPHYIIDGSTLNFTRLSRTDNGAYSCEAINSEGSTVINFTISVQCEYIYSLPHNVHC